MIRACVGEIAPQACAVATASNCGASGSPVSPSAGPCGSGQHSADRLGGADPQGVTKQDGGAPAGVFVGGAAGLELGDQGVIGHDRTAGVGLQFAQDAEQIVVGETGKRQGQYVGSGSTQPGERGYGFR